MVVLVALKGSRLGFVTLFLRVQAVLKSLGSLLVVSLSGNDFTGGVGEWNKWTSEAA